jgi:hypothetical protein
LILPPIAFSRHFPKDWGLIIGVENFDSLPNVKFARKDALIIKDYFVRLLGVPNNLSGKKALQPMRIIRFLKM